MEIRWTGIVEMIVVQDAVALEVSIMCFLIEKQKSGTEIYIFEFIEYELTLNILKYRFIVFIISKSHVLCIS